MASKSNKRTDPLQNLFTDIAKIIDFIAIKDQKKADSYETKEIKAKSTMWMRAKMQKDTYTTYRNYWNFAMFQQIVSNIKVNDFKYYMTHPANIPVDFRDNLLEKGREKFLEQYVEENDYYRMLNGLPPVNTDPKDYVYLSEAVRNQLHAPTDPVHLLSPLIQNNYMNTDEYKKVLEENPDKEYLKYLGIYKVDLFTARNAKDFEIIRYVLNRSDINPNLINQFATTYADYREYVMVTLYNEHMEGIYEGYRNFMGMIIMMMTLMQLMNNAVEAINTFNFLDDSILHIILSMYDIPSDLLLTNEVRRKLVINMLKLTKEKGTDEIYYHLVDILGYQDVIISKLLLMKGQQFDPNDNYKVTDENKPYFIQLDLKDNNPYETISSGKAPIHEYHSVVDDDPMWWDDAETQMILQSNEYSESNSKYIMAEAIIHQMKYMFESIYFTRLVLDNKFATDSFMIEIPELFGTELVSIYDLMVFIISAMCMNNGMKGEIISNETKLLATAGFNFELDFESFEEFLNTTSYVDRDRVMEYLKNLTMSTPADINRLFNEVLYPMREWLEDKIAKSTNRHEYLEYESIYRALYTYDINNNTFLDDFKLPLQIICEKYGITEDEMLAYKSFYPQEIIIVEKDGRKEEVAVRVEDVESNTNNYHRYFLAFGNEVDYFIHVIIDTPRGDDDRGIVYLHDILNCEDLRELENDDGTRPFMDYNDSEVGWVVNWKAVNKAIELINGLDDKALYKAYFQINTHVPNSSKIFYANEKLPSIIRSGIYKTILIDKLTMDMNGYAKEPITYQEYLYRKNEKLYNLLIEGNRFELNKEAWLEDVMKVVLAVETELDLHMKYFEQAVLGPDLYFKPLITLIRHFKSTFVDFAKTGLKFEFDDKMDSGGSSNMFKLFDEVDFIVHFVTLAHKGYESQFGLYDTEHQLKYHIEMNDRSQILRMVVGEGFLAETRETTMGSIRMVDEAKFFKNGKPLDPGGYSSVWYSGEPGTGRWSEEDDILMRARSGVENIQNAPVDFDGWKEYREASQ